MGFVHRRRRGAELVLLLLSLVVGIGAYAAVGLGVDGTLPVNLFTYGDSLDINTWSNIPYYFRRALLAHGMRVNPIDITPPLDCTM